MRKQILVIITLMMIAALLIPVTAAAQDNATINGAEVHIGDKITYELSIDEASDIAIGLQLEIYFNDDILKVTQADSFNLENSVLNPNKYGNGKIMFNASSLKGYDFIDGKELLKIEFEVIGKGHTKIIEDFMCFYDINYDEIDFSYSHVLKKNNVILVEKELETTAPTTTVVFTTQAPTTLTPTTETSTASIPVTTTTPVTTTAKPTAVSTPTTSEITLPILTTVTVTDSTEPFATTIYTTTSATTSVATIVGSSDQIVSEPNSTEIIITEPTEVITTSNIEPTDITENKTEITTDYICVSTCNSETTSFESSSVVDVTSFDVKGTTSIKYDDLSGNDIVCTGDLPKGVYIVGSTSVCIAFVAIFYITIKKDKK